MKFIILSMLALGIAQAGNLEKKDAGIQYEEYEPNDGTARPGNPGTFTSKGLASNIPETNLELENHPKVDKELEIQAEEAEFDDEVLK